MEARKQQFLSWVSSKTIKKITPNQFADLIEDAFSTYLKKNVWSVSKEEFPTLCDNLLNNKEFKKKQRKMYKLFKTYNNLYFLFLSSNALEPKIKPQPPKLDARQEITIKYKNEYEKCLYFFLNKGIAKNFYQIYEYCKDKIDKIYLDVRASIIGAKFKNERLRFYADKKGVLRFTKIGIEPIDLKVISSHDLDLIYSRVDEVNGFFQTHAQEVSLEKEENKYIYHKSFGFGKVIYENGQVLLISFDNQSESKKILKGHSSYVEISKEDYTNKIVPVFKSPDEDSQTHVIKKGEVGTQDTAWDKYEIALLIEAYWKIRNKEGKRDEIVESLSRILRLKAQEEGAKMDETYRSIRNVNVNLSNVISIFLFNTSSKNTSTKFEDMVRLYNQKRNDFNVILQNAHVFFNVDTTNSKLIHSVQWNDIGDLSATKPMRVSYHGNSKENFKDWAECYKYVCSLLCKDFRPIFHDLAKDPSYSYVSYNRNNFRIPVEIVEYIYTEGSRSATNLMKLIKSFLNKCRIPLNDLVIEYSKLENVESSVNKEATTSRSLSVSETEFYAFIKVKYLERYQADGRVSEADIFAQKCINIIRVVNDLLNRNILSISSFEVLEEVRLEIAKYSLDKNYKAYLYVLGRFGEFLKINMSKQHNAKILDEKDKLDVSDYKKVIESVFSEGFAYENQLRKRKFINSYKEILNKPFEDSDEIFLKKIRLVGFISEGKVYLPSIVSDELKEEIKSYIEESFNKTSAIYYSTLYERFREKFNSLFGEDMLINYLKYVFEGEYNFCNDYIAKKGVQVNLREELINLFMNAGRPMNIEEIYGALPNANHSAINSIIKDKDFIVNFRGKSYFYKEIFIIDDNQLAEIDNFIAQQLKIKDQISGGELYEYINKELPDVIQSNPGVTELGIKNMIRINLDYKYNFKGDIISKQGSTIDVKTLYSEFCQNRERFSLDELDEFKESIGKRYIDWNAIMMVSVRTSQTLFVRRDFISFDFDKIDEAISRYCKNDYVSFADIINFTDFPTIEINWNKFVLESYVYYGSKEYKLIHAAFNDDKPVGAIVKINSHISNFDDLLVDIIKDFRLFDEEKAFEYLLENDYIRTRKVKNIASLIEKAKRGD